MVSHRVAVVITVVVKGDTVELLERVRNLAHWRRKARVQWHTLDPRGSDVDTLALFDIPEVWCLNAVTLVRDDGWFRMAQQRPLCGSEERCSLDVGSTSARAQALSLVLDQQLAHNRLAKATHPLVNRRELERVVLTWRLAGRQSLQERAPHLSRCWQKSHYGSCP